MFAPFTSYTRIRIRGLLSNLGNDTAYVPVRLDTTWNLWLLYTNYNTIVLAKESSSQSQTSSLAKLVNNFIMSGTTYSTFQSSSYSSSSDSSGNQYTEATVSNPSGTTVHRTSQEAGQPAVSETTRIPAGGTAAVQGGADSDRRIEDVTDTDHQYEERMEDEYAKREGGA
ncbi:MAG: hypothetical protein LQ337_002386 [Flavoplaca oasis]|nr:MAG: hypothetical protein LQ337_002386 [Flavoplaca oasis]